METKEKIKEVLTNLLKLKAGDIQDNATLCDGIGADSTEMVELVIALEKAFAVKLKPKEVTKFCTVDDIEKIIQSKLASA